MEHINNDYLGNLDFQYNRCLTQLQKDLPVSDFSFDLKKHPKRHKAILAMSPFERLKLPAEKKKKDKSVIKKKNKPQQKLKTGDELAAQKNQKLLKESSTKIKGLNELRMGQTSFD